MSITEYRPTQYMVNQDSLRHLKVFHAQGGPIYINQPPGNAVIIINPACVDDLIEALCLLKEEIVFELTNGSAAMALEIGRPENSGDVASKAAVRSRKTKAKKAKTKARTPASKVRGVR